MCLCFASIDKNGRETSAFTFSGIELDRIYARFDCARNELPHVYSRKYMKKFNDIKTRNDLATLLNIPRSSLTHLLYVVKPDRCYKVFSIPKKNGGAREINAPQGVLKDVQKALARELWRYISSIPELKDTAISHAFTKKKSIITNARIHRNKRIVINFDLKDFFPSIHFGRVVGFFEKNRHFMLPHEVALIIAQIACHDGSLPQGSPCSPIISNLICQILDYRLLRVAKKYKLDYTRYADDLTFSTNLKDYSNSEASFFSEVENVIKKAGFTINESKTRIVFRSSRQDVTGIVVNKKISVNHDYCRKTKAMAYSLYTKGSFLIDGKEGSLNQLEGRFAFIDYIDRYNNASDGGVHNSTHLSGRERQYRRFLFYKYFFAAEQPLLITEGKTDMLYLKAALRSLYEKYPLIVRKNDNGSFVYNIRFLNRSKRLKYFFGASSTGGDAMTGLKGFFDGSDNREDLYHYFTNLSKKEQSNPVVFLFDNETATKRPLNKFLSQEKTLKKQQLDSLENQLWFQVFPSSKLFVLTTPLIEGRAETEIEDLLPERILSTRIDGREFSRSDKWDPTKSFGKDILSKHVYDHSESIDFSGFTPMLDALSQIIELSNNLEVSHEQEIQTADQV